MVQDNPNFTKKITAPMEKNDEDSMYDDRKLYKYLERHSKRQQSQSATEIPDCRKGKFTDS
eukprot:677773-Ditylum_brightwellii.AAC.1